MPTRIKGVAFSSDIPKWFMTITLVFSLSLVAFFANGFYQRVLDMESKLVSQEAGAADRNAKLDMIIRDLVEIKISNNMLATALNNHMEASITMAEERKK